MYQDGELLRDPKFQLAPRDHSPGPRIQPIDAEALQGGSVR